MIHSDQGELKRRDAHGSTINSGPRAQNHPFHTELRLSDAGSVGCETINDCGARRALAARAVAHGLGCDWLSFCAIFFHFSLFPLRLPPTPQFAARCRPFRINTAGSRGCRLWPKLWYLDFPESRRIRCATEGTSGLCSERRRFPLLIPRWRTLPRH